MRGVLTLVAILTLLPIGAGADATIMGLPPSEAMRRLEAGDTLRDKNGYLVKVGEHIRAYVDPAALAPHFAIINTPDTIPVVDTVLVWGTEPSTPWYWYATAWLAGVLCCFFALLILAKVLRYDREPGTWSETKYGER